MYAVKKGTYFAQTFLITLILNALTLVYRWLLIMFTKLIYHFHKSLCRKKFYTWHISHSEPKSSAEFDLQTSKLQGKLEEKWTILTGRVNADLPTVVRVVADLMHLQATFHKELKVSAIYQIWNVSYANFWFDLYFVEYKVSLIAVHIICL